MAPVLRTPVITALPAVIDALRQWQATDRPVQLHPGDVGWFWRFGAEATAAALRTWTHDGALVAVGLLDGPDVLRLAFAPSARDNAALAEVMASAITDPDRGVLPAGQVSVETPNGAALHGRLGEVGWLEDEAWQPLRRELAEPVPRTSLRVEVVASDTASVRAAVQRAAFDRSTFSDQLWQAMAAGPAYAQARCLIGYDHNDAAVAAATVWSAGPGRPGLIEPLGVDRAHRRRGHGVAITLASVAALGELGACCSDVVTPASNTGAIAVYRAAGFVPLPLRHDRYRPA